MSKIGYNLRGKFDQFIRRINLEGDDTSPATIYAVSGYNEQEIIQATGTTRITSWTSEIQYNYAAVGMYLYWDIHNQPVSGTVQLFVDLYNPATQDTAAIWQSDVISGTGTVTTLHKYLFYPGAVDDGSQLNGVDRIPIPPQWKIRLTHDPEGAPWNLSWAYSIVAAYVDS